MPTTIANNFDPSFQLTPNVRGDSVKVVREKIRAWIASQWFVELLNLFGCKIELHGKMEDVLHQLEDFSRRWDYRRIARERGMPADDALVKGVGAARWLSAETGLSRQDEERVLHIADRLGLIRAQNPTRQTYDYILVLGGARLSCKMRTLRAAQVLLSGVSARAVILLGSTRAVSESERDATDTYAPNAANEFDLFIAGGSQVLEFDENRFQEERHEDPTNNNLSWISRTYQITWAGHPLLVLALAAPSSDPDRRRANSADTLQFFLQREMIPVNSQLLLITSQIYVPYVQLESLREIGIPRRIGIETIGFPGDRMPEIQGLSNPNHYLQEIRSTIQAALRFCLAHSDTDVNIEQKGS